MMKGTIEIEPVIIHLVHKLCLRPYPNHKKGCPNFGKKKDCPPGVPKFDIVYDLSKPIYAIYNGFDFKGHVDRMREKHPDWSRRQLECCLYWQGTARKQLKQLIEEYENPRPKGMFFITTTPEAMGVNVTKTMRNAGVVLEWPPVNVVYQIAIAGILKMRMGEKING